MLGRTKSELLDSLSEDELIEQLAYDQIENSDSWYQNAQLCEIVRLIASGKKHDKFDLEKWLPVKPQKRRMSDDEMLKKVQAVFGRAKKGD